MPLFDFALMTVSLVLAVPCAVFFVECLLGAISTPRARPLDEASARPRVAVLMPAHDEREVIADTLAGLLPELQSGDRLLVVADNCSDDTAAIARAAGATVIERSDRERRGKGYALAYGLQALVEHPPDVVVIMD